MIPVPNIEVVYETKDGKPKEKVGTWIGIIRGYGIIVGDDKTKDYFHWDSFEPTDKGIEKFQILRSNNGH